MRTCELKDFDDNAYDISVYKMDMVEKNYKYICPDIN